MLEMFNIVQCSSCQLWLGPESFAGEAHLSLRQPGSWHQGGFWEELELVMVELRVLFLLGVNAILYKVGHGFKVDTLYLLPKAQVRAM